MPWVRLNHLVPTPGPALSLLIFAVLILAPGKSRADEPSPAGQQSAQAQSVAPASPQPQQPAPSPLPSSTAAPATSPAPPGTPAVVVNGKQVESILGKKVLSDGGDNMGRIVDILADKSGQVRAAIIDFGGFLGVGTRQIAVDWKAIRFPKEKSDAVVVELSRDQLRTAPVYKAGEQIVVLGMPAAKDAQSAAPQAPAQEAASSVARGAPSN